MPYKNQIWINGSFDVLHMGHIKLFQRARQMGLPVMVGLDTDERISKLKGSSRPINNLKDRVEFLKSIKYIDGIVTFSTDDELVELIKGHAPRYMLVGDDYEGKEIIGGEFVKEIIYVKRYGGLSTSNVVNETHKT
tara:strand:- start:315 stop:722 length:408 start_codon:yes stop_codon:yes gene_type:complete